MALLVNFNVSRAASVPESAAMVEWAIASSLTKRLDLKINLLDRRSFGVTNLSSLMKELELYSYALCNRTEKCFGALYSEVDCAPPQCSQGASNGFVRMRCSIHVAYGSKY